MESSIHLIHWKPPTCGQAHIVQCGGELIVAEPLQALFML